MEQEFRPQLNELQAFDGKVSKVEYNEFTQYLSIGISKEHKMASFSGIVRNQEDVDAAIKGLTDAIGWEAPKTEEARPVQPKTEAVQGPAPEEK